ncbi:polyketide cyclase [Mycobacterium dioxanotrophicus]|jgi:hypothetical protein|uniref:Polyketide cyclase n=1 Tax=Mycobacterium dioxanotrophicus TaxID=482462 RepID=A0A1Y0C041_9MYCO|nr:SRPBCC family protein [Mycobacterium dioxanotrophicus]ART68485.1 polyketide cyclase [Mycobacterium dioxanotrophicus]
MVQSSPAAVDSPLIVKRHTTASRKQVWDVVADGWTYSQWVVGNTRMRAVTPDWPAPGSKIHHTIGVWPVVVNDETIVESCTPLEELVLFARVRPFGGARITLRLADIHNGSRIEMAEVPVGGPLNWVPRRLSLLLVYPRNRECVERLAALAERREAPQ